MGVRPCLDCGALTTGSRCRTCARPRELAGLRGKRARRPRVSSEDNRRAQTVAAWRAQHGDWCPGWQVPPHASADLTADHVRSYATTGDEHGALGVLCRTCNGRKAATI